VDGRRGGSSQSYPAPLTLERIHLAGNGIKARRIVRHGLTHGLVDGFLQGWPQISGQLLQDIIRPELSGFVKEALMKHRRFTG